MSSNEKRDGFTLPGEAGYENLTLELAKRWGADVIRDSDGTVLSEEILNSGYGIYSTICIIRDHNDWARKNMDKLQQTFLMTTGNTDIGFPGFTGAVDNASHYGNSYILIKILYCSFNFFC